MDKIYKYNRSEILDTTGYSILSSPTYCKLTYNSFGHKQTLSFFPYRELSACSKDHVCNIGEYQCREKNYCVDLKNVCDGIIHCHHGDDEEFCSNY